MASQTEIHLNPNDVINAAERTFLSCVGKPSHVNLNIHLSTCVIVSTNTNTQILPLDKYLIDMIFTSDHLNMTLIEISSRDKFKDSKTIKI